MEVHLAVGQSANRLAVLADIGDQHNCGMLLHELFGVNYRGRAEAFREADFVLLRQVLIAQENDEIRASLPYWCGDPLIHLPA